MTNTFDTVYYLETEKLYYITNSCDSFDYENRASKNLLSIDFSEEIFSEEPLVIPLDIDGICIHQSLYEFILSNIDDNTSVSVAECYINGIKQQYYYHLKTSPYLDFVGLDDREKAGFYINDYSNLNLLEYKKLNLGHILNRTSYQEIFFSSQLACKIINQFKDKLSLNIFIEIPLYEQNLIYLKNKEFSKIDQEWFNSLSNQDSFLKILRVRELLAILEFCLYINDMELFRKIETKIDKKKLNFSQKKIILNMANNLI